MDPSFHFEALRYYQALLDGARGGFQMLKERYSAERIYYYALTMPASYASIEPGIRTEDGLLAEVEFLLPALARKGRPAALDDLRRALRYQTPEPRYSADVVDNPPLETANRLLAGFGAEWVRCLDTDQAVVTTDEDGQEVVVTPLDDIETVVRETPRQVLRALDEEGLFGAGAARRVVVLDTCWAEASMPDAYIFLDLPEKDQPSPLNPPDVQAAYVKALAEGRAMRRALFG